MYDNARFIPVLLLVTTLLGCIGPQKAIEPHYSYLALTEIAHLKHDGFIIGMEKRLRKSVGAPSRGYPGISTPTRLPNVPVRDSLRRVNTYESLINHRNAIYITHMFRYDRNSDANIRTIPVFNGYRDSRPPRFPKGFDALSLLDQSLEHKLALADSTPNPYTHIIAMSMGWNTDQFEAISNFNTITDSLTWAAEQSGNRSFRPLVVGITWPSVWMKGSDFWISRKLGHMFSYYNKANDADEIGYTIANRLLHDILLPKKIGRPSLNVILIGHSFGARLLSRALFSREYLHRADANENLRADLFIGLQGAFSAYRFLSNRGGEGAPYDDFREIGTPIVLTASRNDRANSAARLLTFGARHVGGISGIQTACEYPNKFQIIEWKSVDRAPYANAGCRKYNPGQLDPLKGGVHLVDATSIIKEQSSIGPYFNYTAAHSDILDREMGELIWWILETFTG